MKKKLFTTTEFKNAMQLKCFIVIHMPEKSTINRTKIHQCNCKNLHDNFTERYGLIENKELGKSNNQEYWLYDSMDEIMDDFPNATQCKKCSSS